jgi:small-conductance mechanosensitive channel
MTLRLVLVLIFSCLFGASGFAQSAFPIAPAPPAASAAPVTQGALAAEVDDADAALRELSRSFGAVSLSDAQITARLALIPPIQAKLSDALDHLTPRLAAVDARLAQLGAAPAPGQPREAPEIAQSRSDLNRFRQAVDTEIKQARLLQVEASQITAMLVNRQQQQLHAQLWAHSRSLLDPRLWTAFAEAVPDDVSRLQTVLVDEGDAWAKAAGSQATLWGWATAVVFALAIAVPLRWLLNRLALARVGQSAPKTRLRRTLLALGQVLIATLTPLVALLLARNVFAATGAMTPAFEQAAPLLIRVVVFASFFESLGRALLSPGRPSWRLAPIPDAMVARLAAYPAIIGVTAAFAAFVRGANVILGASPPTTIASDCITVLIELLAVGGALSTLGRARSQHLASAESISQHQAESRLPWIIAALLAWLTLAAALAAVLLGYVEMASKLMEEMVWIATVLASLFLLLRFVDDLFPALVSPERSIGRFLLVAIGLSEATLEQLSVLLAGLCRLALLLFGWAAILAPFGAGAGDVFGRVTSSQLLIKIGQVSISPGAILGAIAVFLVGLLVTRAIRGWLERSYLPKTAMDSGLQASLASGVTYLGAVLAILLTCGYLGLSLDKIALFASALSVGIGFGLQAVIGNFVSGLILLAERPIKVGDWIAIGDLEGDVKRINVRATEIEMQDRSKLIVPNSDLISKTVRNVTHAGSLGRVKIVLKTVDTADPAEVRDLVLARLQAHPNVLKEPAAAVYLSNIADGALEFTAFAYLSSPRLAYRTRSDLLFQIVPDLKSHGVSLANSTPVVNVGLPDRPIEPSAASEV